MEKAPIFIIDGPPAAGKTTLCEALLRRFSHGLHLPVDEMRGWVTSGFSDSVPWTDETERQFQISEEASFDVAVRYQAAGFAVAVDHCRNLRRMEKLATSRLEGLPVVKICLVPNLEINLLRNHERTNKPFDPKILDTIIRAMNASLRQDVPPGWKLIDTTGISPDETVEQILEERFGATV